MRSDLERTVSQPIEQQLTGLDGMLYYFAPRFQQRHADHRRDVRTGDRPRSGDREGAEQGQHGLPLLPAEVQRLGVTTKKVSSSFLLFIALTSPDNRYDALFLNNYAAINLVDKIGSLPGVGNSQLSGSQSYGMRIWVNPDKMAKLGLTATDISNAVQAQNRQNPAGSLGQPPEANGNRFPISGERDGAA